MSNFEIGFAEITAALKRYGIDCALNASGSNSAEAAWQVWSRLTEADYDAIARTLLDGTGQRFLKTLRETLEATPLLLPYSVEECDCEYCEDDE